MPSEPVLFGTVDRQDVHEIFLDNGRISCSVLTYGCVLRTLNVSDRNGKLVDVILGYDDLQSYVTLSGRMGAVIGRYANRIKDGRFPLNGKDVQLSINREPNHIHGGFKGFDKRIWGISEYDSDHVKLHYSSASDEEGYPGNMEVYVTYRLHENSLTIRYEAESDMDTICNLTNHSYFNLSGTNRIDGHRAYVCADRFVPVGEDGIPTGEVSNVNEDNGLRNPKLLENHPFDVCYLLDSCDDCAGCCSDATGIRMSVSTDMPAIQFYTADNLKECIGKNGMKQGERSGICFETQFPPDSPNNPQFGDCVLRKGEKYEHGTTFSFYRF